MDLKDLYRDIIVDHNNAPAAMVMKLVDGDTLAVLARFGGFEIAMLTGAMLAAASQRMVVLIDGFIVSAAALVAARLAPALVDYCIFCHHSVEPGHQAQLRALQVTPLLDLGLRLGEGTGAALAWPLGSCTVGALPACAAAAIMGSTGGRLAHAPRTKAARIPTPLPALPATVVFIVPCFPRPNAGRR